MPNIGFIQHSFDLPAWGDFIQNFFDSFVAMCREERKRGTFHHSIVELNVEMLFFGCANLSLLFKYGKKMFKDQG